MMLQVRLISGAAAIAMTASAMSLAGCGASGSLPNVSTITSDINSLQAVVAEITSAACTVVPTAVTIAGLVTANPALTTASQIAAVICGVKKTSKVFVATRHVRSAMMKLRRGDSSGSVVIGTYVAPNGTSIPITVYQ